MPGRVLVTGGAGYVGSHACKALATRGHDVVVVDNLSRGFRELVRWGTLEVADIRDRPTLTTIFRRYEPGAVMHFAAFAYVEESVVQPALYFENNVSGSLALLGAMLDTGCKRLVFSSTCAVYGKPEALPIVESQPLAPVNPYGTTKLTTERALSAYDAAYGLRSVALRYFNAAGADAALEVGERHNPETHLIPRALDVAAGLSPSLPIYGVDYDTPDGSCVRDYIHVSDLAEAHVAALEYLERGGASLALNLGTGEGHSVLRIATEVERVTKRAVPREIRPRRPGDPPSLVADVRRAQEVLGWRATRSDLGTIVDNAWAWHGRLRGTT
jgi:UDP-arabinose 4-epimerase